MNEPTDNKHTMKKSLLFVGLDVDAQNITIALALTGELVDGKEHYDRALEIYDPAEHRQLTTRSGRDIGWPSWRLVRAVSGYLVITRLLAMTPSSHSRMPAKPAMPPH